MAFWGIELKPGKPYTHRYDGELGRLHLSHATLGSGSSTKKTKVQCNVGDKKPIYLCSLLPDKLETCQLNLEFAEEDEVTFSVVGPHSVHLSGFFLDECQDNHEDYDSDPYGEDIVGTESESDDSIDYGSEDEDEDGYEEDYSGDDLIMYPPSPIPNSGVTIEEIVDDEVLDDSKSKRLKKKNNTSGSEAKENSDGQIIVKGKTGVTVLESEDEDGFPISSHSKVKAPTSESRLESGGHDEKTQGKASKNSSKDDTNCSNGLKRKLDATGQEDHISRGTDKPLDSSVPNHDIPETDKKQRRKTKKKKVSGEAEITQENGGKHINPVELNSVDKQISLAGMENGVEPVCDKGKQKKKKKKNKKQDCAGEANIDKKVVEENGGTVDSEKKDDGKPFQMRSFPNGLVIEELAMGKPNGKRASPGKKVSVHYIGKLRKNGKIFDSNIGKSPFKFRLGVGHVIKGWDVGVNGMRVGDKRRLTIPPAMGYGAKGAGAVIPGNSWLVFDVELVDVN